MVLRWSARCCWSARCWRCRACSRCPSLWSVTRWYLRRAPAGYLRENAAYSDVTDGLSETVEGSRTTEALRPAGRGAGPVPTPTSAGRTRPSGTPCPAVRSPGRSPRSATCCRWWPPCWSAAGSTCRAGSASAQVTAATLYVQQLIDPLDRLLSWLDELQVGGASMARLLGRRRPRGTVAERRARRADQPGERGSPASRAGDRDRRLAARDVRYAYREGRDVLHGVDLAVAPGERLAMVGPSGAGKSTLGRLLAGIHAPAYRLGHRRRRAAGRAAAGRAAPAGRPGHPGAPRLHRHAARQPGDGPAGRRPTAEVRAALAAVDALDWAARRCRPGWTPWSARAGTRCPPPRRSSSRWPGWSSPTRTRWCWTRPPR